MQKFEDNGDINGVEVNLLIKTIENDGTTTTVINDTVEVGQQMRILGII